MVEPINFVKIRHDSIRHEGMYRGNTPLIRLSNGSYIKIKKTTIIKRLPLGLIGGEIIFNDKHDHFYVSNLI